MPHKDPEQRRAYAREQRRRNRYRTAERDREYGRKYHQEHRDECLARMKAWRERTKEARKAYRKEEYQRNRAKYLADRRAMLKRLRDLSDKIKSEAGCMCCGENDPACLDFHHNDPSEKVAHVSTLASAGVNVKVYLAEIAKCSVICANCHRIRHWQRKTGLLL